MAVELTHQLREGTKKTHIMTKNTGFVGDFPKSVVDKSSYRKLIIDPWNVYSAIIKDMFFLRGHPVVEPINFTALSQWECLERDLVDYLEREWKILSQSIQRAEKYLEEIHNLASGPISLRVFPPCTPYVGDLSSDVQVLKTIAQRAMNLAERHGLRFYEFDAIGKVLFGVLPLRLREGSAQTAAA